MNIGTHVGRFYYWFKVFCTMNYLQLGVETKNLYLLALAAAVSFRGWLAGGLRSES